MEGMTITQILALLKPLSLPLFVWFGKWLKTKTAISNGLIPYAILGVNGISWFLLSTGLAVEGPGGALEGVTPDSLGVALAGVPLLGMMAWSMGGLFGTLVGAGLSLVVEQVGMNYAHKGLKYRAMFKAAEIAGIIPANKARDMRRTSPW